MKEQDLGYYKAIGKIYKTISSAEDFEHAVVGSLRTVLDTGIADYAVVWAADPETKTLRPLYWICPADLTSERRAFGEGTVGRVYEKGERETSDCTVREKSILSSYGCDVTSEVCLPLESRNGSFGCIEFLRKEGRFSDDEAEVCALLTLMTATQIEDESALPSGMDGRRKLIEVKDIHKYFRNGDEMTHVLKGVNFDVFEGEFLCLLGESGSGKSTVLNILGGILDSDRGSVVFDGKEITGLSQKEITRYRRDNIGYIFQSYNLMPNLNAKQNLELIGELAENPLDADELLETVGLGEQKNRYPSMLSGGQQQRVAIARAMIKNPKIILADEPTAALDYATSIEVLSVMEKVVRNGTTLIVVTHNEEISKMADRIIRFRNGRTYEITVNRHPENAENLVW